MNKLDIVVKACEDKLGDNIKVISIDEKSTIADYFVIVTGKSIQQTKAISDEIEQKIEKAGFTVLGNEGFRDASWILMDLGDIIVHIFTEEQREFYNLEKLWD
ncbi:ribosome silencing factor [Helcococcus ovis]|uniref:Ribosomal silencing factor RsfS n=1 Tax=Helcococcus ovis TaxID=72026 RepID=A0A4R9C4G7_9FIRM|nr:ribosome silencing factor [Helcococcus ovis]TFF64352.1 ribosome silencing factor [Helcococcus ovis]TFF66486.1 ribosome silencing factor [Helcococcus ovis]TFF67047.1 ribosome silencing factor [Helcococcus ovis]WNZ01819.1 ribosome silencing factor [Helcococcus ovis]